MSKEQRVLLIDDMRYIQADEVARTYDEAIEKLKSEIWDIVLLDHDLGDVDPHKTGYFIMCFLEQNPQYLPRHIVFVTSNPVGRKNMEIVRKRLYNLSEEEL